jgi:hypothetical protein
MALTRADRERNGRYGAWVKLSHSPDRAALTANARAAFLDRFERQVDPDGRLDPVERAKLAAYARRAYFAKLAIASAKARAAKRGGDGPA